MIRALMIVTAIIAALPATVAAQHGRQFKDAWFWGIKGGGITLADSGQAYKQAPMVGIDWMITRTHGGLYVSGAESFFTQQTFVLRDAAAGVDSGFRVVDLKNMRKLDVAIMGFPGDHIRFHPYVGAGFTLSQVADAQPQGPFGNPDQITSTAQVIQAQRAAVSPLFIGGAQYRMTRFSVFGQLTLSPAQKEFILYNGRPWNFGYEVGLRYNFGSSISRD
jgi:opacity protein-like surface antigen